MAEVGGLGALRANGLPVRGRLGGTIMTGVLVTVQIGAGRVGRRVLGVLAHRGRVGQHVHATRHLLPRSRRPRALVSQRQASRTSIGSQRRHLHPQCPPPLQRTRQMRRCQCLLGLESWLPVLWRPYSRCRRDTAPEFLHTRLQLRRPGAMPCIFRRFSALSD